MQTPGVGKPGVRDRLAKRVGRATKHGGGLGEVVLKQEGLSKARPDAEFVFTAE